MIAQGNLHGGGEEQVLPMCPHGSVGSVRGSISPMPE
jgi:hypothetical protein